MTAVARPVARLADVDDVDLGIRLLRGTPTNESRSTDVLRQVSRAAQQFGAALAAGTSSGDARPEPQVVERADGLGSGTPAVARYLPRRHRVELFTDVIAHCERVIDTAGWRHWFPPGTVRAAALAHERAHELVVHGHAAELRRAVGVPAVRIGRWTRWAHVAGADELAAHAYAQARLGLPRSPLLVTAAATAALERRSGAPSTSVEED